MAGVAWHNSNITDSIKSNHVHYSIENYEPTGSYCSGGYDENDECLEWSPSYGWVNGGSGSTSAKITGQVFTTYSKLKVSEVSVAVVGDSTVESWTVSPPIPEDTDDTRYTATSPISGSGQGEITSGSSKLFLGGKAVALVGSTVETCLNTITTINSGTSKFNVAG